MIEVASSNRTVPAISTWSLERTSLIEVESALSQVIEVEEHWEDGSVASSNHTVLAIPAVGDTGAPATSGGDRRTSCPEHISFCWRERGSVHEPRGPRCKPRRCALRCFGTADSFARKARQRRWSNHMRKWWQNPSRPLADVVFLMPHAARVVWDMLSSQQSQALRLLQVLTRRPQQPQAPVQVLRQCRWKFMKRIARPH